MREWMLAAVIALAGSAFSDAEAQAPTKTEAQAIVANLKPVFLGGRTTSVSAAFDFQNDYVIVANYGVKVEAGQRVRYDPCLGILDRYLKVLDDTTIVVTRMGPLRVTIGVASVLTNFTITDVVQRGGADSDWRIVYEHVTVWPRDHDAGNGACNG